MNGYPVQAIQFLPFLLSFSLFLWHGDKGTSTVNMVNSWVKYTITYVSTIYPLMVLLAYFLIKHFLKPVEYGNKDTVIGDTVTNDTVTNDTVSGYTVSGAMHEFKWCQNL